MKSSYILMSLILTFGSLAAHAAGSPLNESFTNLIELSNNALEVGKKGDTQAFIDSTTIAWEALKVQNDKGSSIRLQRANSKLKSAIKVAKAGNLAEAMANVEQGIVEMKLEK